MSLMAKKRTIAAIIGGVLLTLPWVGLGSYTVFIGLIPLLYISDSFDKGRRNFWKTFGYAAILLGIWSAITTWWIWIAAPVGAILSVLITIGLFGGVFMVYHWMSKRAPSAVAYTLLVSGWIAAEFLYTKGEVSFPWLMLGNAFSGDIKLVQWYDTFGVFGGSLWVWLVNIALYSALKYRNQRNWVVAAVVLLLPITASLIRYYTYTEKGQDVTVTVVQPNIDPYSEKFILPQSEQTELLLSMAEQAPDDVDFIVMPETAIDEGIWENDWALKDNRTVGQFRDVIVNNFPEAQIITGATTYYRYMPGERVSETARTASTIDYYYDIYNTAMSIDATEEVGLHHKTELVIGVEKMPYMAVVKLLEDLIIDLGGTTGQLGVDSICRPLSNSAGLKYGTPICYEAVYGETTAEFVENGAELLFIISNDGWWGDTNGHRHLFKFSRLRALETRRSIGRSANTGTSGFINQRGDVINKVGWDVRTVITEEIKANDKLTFYTRYGDLVARISTLLFFLSIGYYIAIAYRRRNLME